MVDVKVIETTLGTGSHASPGPMLAAVERFLRSVLPAANPDFENFYGKVCKWWIEIDPTGVPQRELGFDQRGDVIVAGPMGRNFGYFTDSNAVFAPDDYPAIEQVLFEAAWSAFEARRAEQNQLQR